MGENMITKHKIVGICICMLLISTTVPAVISVNNGSINSIVSSNGYQSSSRADWIEIQKLLASDGAADDGFGLSVSLSGEYVVIGKPNENNLRGSAYVFKRSGSSWVEEAKLVASDQANSDWFGWSVSLSGDYIVVGAPGKYSNRGAAYVFKRSGSSWVEEAKLLASDGESLDLFGRSVSISGDYVVAGGTPGDLGCGAAYVFKRSDSSWVEEAKLVASDGAADDWFGESVSISGEYAIVGTPKDDSGRGAAYVFKRSDSSWVEEAKLVASDGAADDWFGQSVSISGEYAIVGTPWDDSHRGAAYVFTCNQLPIADFTWTPQNPHQNQQIAFDASTSQDPDGTITLYEWDWDNDSTYDESHPLPTATHSWANAGSYPVTVRVTDDEDYTGTITKTVEVSGAVNFTIAITGGFGVTAEITNTGTLDATDLQWTFTLTGGFVLLGKTKSGTITSLAAGAPATVKDKPIFGFGKTTIQVEVTCAEGVSVTKTATGIVFLFFVLGVK
jgi:hypothetical protein